MGITSSLITGLSGLSTNQSKLDVVGNNIANVNTVGFKSSRLDFKSQFLQTFSYGSAPNADLGGTNPLQVGLGAVAGGVSRNFSDGSTEVTGVPSNLAISGDGFFIVKDGGQFYTRDGSFKLNSNNELVNSDGLRVQGFGVDSNFSVVPGVLQSLSIPLGSMTISEITTKYKLNGNLNADGKLPTQVSTSTLGTDLYVSNGAGGVTGTAPTASTSLTQLAKSDGTLLFASTDQISLTGTVGSRSAAAKTMTAGTATLGDFMNFINGTLGIDTSAGSNGSLATPAGSALVAGAAPGSVSLQVTGNVGADNNIKLDNSSLTVNGAAGFSWTATPTTDGESVTTSQQVYDSLGTALNVNVTMALVDKNSTGSTWRYYVTSADDAKTGINTNTFLGGGTVNFDVNGNYQSASNTSVTLDRTNTGANPNFTFNLDLSQLAAKTNPSEIFATSDGSAVGTLNKYSIGADGIITGTFTNNVNRTLGQVALATFRNNQGLVDHGSNLFQEGPNSGTAVISTPGQFTAGKIVAGALELSNVDLSSEFVQLISASTGFSASSRVITTSNQLMQELLAAAR